MSEKVTEHKINENTISPEKISAAIKTAHINSTNNTNSEYKVEEKIYNLGFMPLNEVAQLVVDELEETYNLDRVKKLWLPKSQKVGQLMNTDMQLLDEEKMKNVVKDLDPQYSKKIEEISNKLQQWPFWQANKYSIKLVKIDELICLQNYVNLDRTNNHAKKLSKEATVDDLLDYCFDFNRTSPKIHNHMITNNVILFSTEDHDVRTGKIEVRKIPRFAENDSNGKVNALVIPVVEGDPFIYCIRTFAPFQMPDGTTKRVYFLTLQNGVHRAYTLKSLGIEYMPCLVIDPATSAETDLIFGKWSPERKQQNYSQRPPLIKDFFNKELTEKFNVRKRLMCVRVEWKTEKFTT